MAEKPRSARIDGSATFTIETSRITMNCAAQHRTSVQVFLRASDIVDRATVASGRSRENLHSLSPAPKGPTPDGVPGHPLRSGRPRAHGHAESPRPPERVHPDH